MMSSTSTPDLASVNNATASAGMSHSYSHHSANIGGSSPDLVSRRNLANSARNLNGFSQEELSNSYPLNGLAEPTKDQEEPIYQNQRELMQHIIMQQVGLYRRRVRFETIYNCCCSNFRI